MRLTVKRIERLKPKKARLADGDGLYLQVNERGKKSWLLKYQISYRVRWMGLGSYGVFNLDEARKRARAARQSIADGIDPLEAKRASRASRAAAAAKALTFEEAAQQFYAAHEKKWKNRKHSAQFMSSLTAYAFPVLGKLSVADIDTALVLKVIEPHWIEKTETMSRVRGRIEQVLGWCTVRGHRAGDNPARWRNHLSEVLPARNAVAKVEHHAALPYGEIPAFMIDLAKREGVAARALEFLILTAARTGEIIGARWPEIDLKNKMWTVPAGRMKAGREHRVPLSARAMEILANAYREDGNDFIFIGARNEGLSNMAMTTVLRRMERTAITVHGFRSSFRDWAAEQTLHANEVVEMALAHRVADATERAYRRGDLLERRRRLMDDWARYCTRKPPQKVATDNVVSMPVRGKSK